MAKASLATAPTQRPRRVVVVDDSPIARRLIAGALDARAGVEVVAVAAGVDDGLLAIDRCQPDVLSLDLELRDRSGLELLRALEHRSAHPSVIVFSVHSVRGSTVAVEALLLGAHDYLAKPRGMRSMGHSARWLGEELGGRIERLPLGDGPVSAEGSAGVPGRPRLELGVVRSPRVLVIASSTGGPAALRALLEALPAQLPVPVLVVQHLPEAFTASFARQLDKVLAQPVRLAEAARIVEPGVVWLAPGGAHLSLRRDLAGTTRFLRDEGARVEGLRPAADVLFTAAARLFGPSCLGLVLTGLGRDGCAGARQIVDAGGRVFVQDRRSSVAWSMPGAVVRAELASRELGLEAMAGELRIELGLDDG